MSIIKEIRRQDSGWKQNPGASGETSINLNNEIFDYLSMGMVDNGEECGITFRIYREDFDNAIDFIESQLPLYRSTSKSSIMISIGDPIIDELKRSIDLFFHENTETDYTVTLYRRQDGRIYLKHLKQNGFTIRDFLVEYSTSIIFDLTEEGYSLRITE